VASVAIDAVGPEDQGIKLACRSTGWFPKPELHWATKNGQDLQPVTQMEQDRELLFNVLSHVTVRGKETGEISCVIRNSLLKTEQKSVILLSGDICPRVSPWLAAFWVLFSLNLLAIGACAILRYKAKQKVSKKKTSEEETLSLKETEWKALESADKYFCLTNEKCSLFLSIHIGGKEKHNETERLVEDNDESKKENNELKMKNQKLEEENGQLKNDKEKVEKENDELKMKNQKLEEENGHLKNDKEKVEKENDELKMKNQKLEEENDDPKKENQKLEEENDDPKKENQKLEEENEEVQIELKWRRTHKYADDITLIPDTAHPNLSIDKEMKSFSHEAQPHKVPSNPERFDSTVCVLGSEGFSSGKHYWEVNVGRSTEWDLGVARKSIERKGKLSLSPKEGFWILGLSGRDYWAKTDPWTRVLVKKKPKKIGVYLSYKDRQVTFFNVTDGSPLFTFNDCSFSGEVSPFFKNSHKETTMKIVSIREDE
ncbi:butyrophilin subfamily 1 member A1-like, partial [Emydura macquarii macquarii]|uniref:butyrophilin subfamily 1 member A1-like n=1 Tax=Emydura macquarii macquarii TaxID=1129001 RepID=UPI00352A0A15